MNNTLVAPSNTRSTGPNSFFSTLLVADAGGQDDAGDTSIVDIAAADILASIVIGVNLGLDDTLTITWTIDADAS